jgi:hypothetical protein
MAMEKVSGDAKSYLFAILTGLIVVSYLVVGAYRSRET